MDYISNSYCRGLLVFTKSQGQLLRETAFGGPYNVANLYLPLFRSTLHTLNPNRGLIPQ